MVGERTLETLDVRAMPLPVANALAELEAALNPHQQRDLLVEAFRATLRCLGGLALAARIEAGPGPKRPRAEVDAWLMRLSRQALTDGEWVGLTRELLRPWREVTATHPLPGLVDVFVGKGAKLHDGLDGLLGMRKRETVAHGKTGTEAEVQAIVDKRLPQLVELLESLAALWTQARIVVPLERPSEGSTSPQRAWLLHGPTPPRGRWRVVDLGEGERASPGRPVVVDASGKVRLSLEPVVLWERASPEVPEDLFFLDGRDKKTAVFTAFPSMAEVRRKDVLEALGRALSSTEGGGEDGGVAATVRPFRGLASFRAEDAAFFVGREKLVEELTNRITANAWVTVTGASGSGKTSLLAAGVGPALKARVEREREAAGYRGTDTPDYVVVSMRPGPQPMRELRRVLDDELGLEVDEDDCAGRVLDWAASWRRVLVLVVDQAEELITLCHDATERERFGAVLAGLAGSETSPVRVVVSLRVDFMAQLATVASIGDRYQRATQVVTMPERADLVRILREPAERCGARWEEGLAEEIVDGVREQPAGLALMSFVADRLWDRRTPGAGTETLLGREAYQAVGGVEGALSAYADEVIARLTPAQRAVVRELMLRLVTAEGTRDVVARSELESAAGPEGAALLDALIDARLLIAHEGEDKEARVELAHEALLVHWPQLKAWRDEDTEAEVHFARLRAATREWQARNESADALWRGELLAAHGILAKRRELRLTTAERRFVESSQRAQRRRGRVLWGTVGTVVTVLATIGAVALVQWRAAEQAEATAIEREREAREAEQGARAEALRAEARGLVAEGLTQRDEIVGTVLMRAGADLDESARLLAETNGRLLVREWQPVSTDLHGHEGGVVEVAYSPDRRSLLTGSADGTARLWDPRTGAERTILRGHSGQVWSVGYSPDNTSVLTGSADGTARLWDPRTGAERAVLRGHEGEVPSVAYSPDGTSVLTGSWDGTARLWDSRTGAQRVVLRGHDGGVRSVAYSPDGSSVLTGSEDGTARLWDAHTGAERAVLRGHVPTRLGRGIVWSVAYSPEGASVLTSSEDGTARLWDARTGTERAVLRGHTRAVRSAMYSPDGTSVLTGSDDGTARLWNARTGAERAVLLAHEGEGGVVVAFSPDGTSVLTSSRDGARLWDARTGIERAVLRDETAVWSVAYSPDGKSVLTGSGDGTARLWDARVGAERAFLSGHEGAVWTAAYSPDGTSVLTGSQDGTARLWDTHTCAERLVLRGHAAQVLSVAYSPDGTSVLTGSQDGTARLWDERTGAERTVLRGHWDRVWSVAYAPNGTSVLTGAEDGTARLWDAHTGAQRVVLRGHEGGVVSVAYSPDGSNVLTGSKDGTARLWDTLSGAERLVLHGHEAQVLSVAYSPDGMSVATGSVDDTARLWDARTGATRAVLRGHVQRVSVAYSPDGTSVLTGSWDGTARLWDARTGAERAILRGAYHEVAYSPDGTRVFTSSNHGARLWDVRTGAERAILRGHSGEVVEVAYSPDGTSVLTGSADGTVRLWDAHVSPLATRTNLRVCRDTHAVIPVPVPLDPAEYARFTESLWAPPALCADTVDPLTQLGSAPPDLDRPSAMVEPRPIEPRPTRVAPRPATTEAWSVPENPF